MTFYAVLRLVPDAIADERLNVGVVVFRDGVVRWRFLSVFRYPGISEGMVAAVREFMADPPMEEDEVRRICGHWFNCIQLSEPRASMEDIDVLLDDVVVQYLDRGILATANR